MKWIQRVILTSVLLMAGNFAWAANSSITISEKATYYDKFTIPANIRQECKNLGEIIATTSKENLASSGWTVTLDPNIDQQGTGMRLKLQITNAMSSGSAFIGHRKSVSVLAKLFQDDKLLDTYEHTRNSGGGFMGGFKGSCAVLNRCAEALGRDVAKWLKRRSTTKQVKPETEQEEKAEKIKKAENEAEENQ